MPELDADDKVALSLTEVLQPTSTEHLVFAGSVADMLKKYPLADTIRDAEWVMFEGEMVAHVSRIYHDIGADVALTYTQNCSAPTLAKQQCGIRMEDANSHAVRLAFKSASPFVVGTLGPSCLNDSSSDEEAEEAYEKQARTLVSKHAHGVFLDGMPDMYHLTVAARGAYYGAHARELGAYRPMIGSVVLGPDGNLADGTTPYEVIEQAHDLHLDCVSIEGLDCVGAEARSSRLADAASNAGISILVRIKADTRAEERTEQAQMDDMQAVQIATRDLAQSGIRFVGPGFGAGPEMAGVMADTFDQL